MTLWGVELVGLVAIIGKQHACDLVDKSIGVADIWNGKSETRQCNENSGNSRLIASGSQTIAPCTNRS